MDLPAGDGDTRTHTRWTHGGYPFPFLEEEEEEGPLVLEDARLLGEHGLRLVEPPLAAVVAQLAGDLAEGGGRGGGDQVQGLQPVVQFVERRQRSTGYFIVAYSRLSQTFKGP